MKKIIVIGGAGYVGCELVSKLLKKNYLVTVYDLMIYGNNLPENKNLKIIKGDVRDIIKLKESLKHQDTVIHLACISNDPSFELNPKLGQEINFDCFEPLVLAAKENGVKLKVQFTGYQLEQREFFLGFTGVNQSLQNNQRMSSYSLANKFKMFYFYTSQCLLNPKYLNQSLLDNFDGFINKAYIKRCI